MIDRGARPDGIARCAIDLLPSMIGYWDRTLHNVLANRAYADYFGYEPATMLGMHLEDVLGVALYDLNRSHIEAVLAGEPQQFDRTIIDVHGVTRYTQATYVPDEIDGDIVGFSVLVVDVSSRVEAERERDRAVHLFQVAMEHAPIGKAVITADGRWLQVNRALCALLGYTPSELLGRKFRDIVHPDDVETSEEHFAMLIDGSATEFTTEKRYVRKDGSIVSVQRNATIVRDGEFGDVVIAQIQDITARKTAEDNLARQVLVDDLTGLANRRRLMAELAVVTDMSDDTSVGVLFVDVDEFKSINDRYGHAVGDRILVAIGQRVSDNTRGNDLACRIGGDEFIVLLRSAATRDGVMTLADRVRGLLSGSYDVDGVSIDVTVSVGWSWNPDVEPIALLHLADESMYRAKRG